MSALIFDIETVGEEYDSFDDTTKESLTRWLKKEASTEALFEAGLQDLKDGLGFSPFTGFIVAIGVLDHEKQKGCVYYQGPEAETKDVEEGNITFKALSEKEMLQSFWKGVAEYSEFVTFNGRGFDVPFLMLRSAILGVRPSKDLLSNRYLGSQRMGARHIDLMDQFTFYGATWKKPSLHLAARAFGIKSPKGDGVSGDMVQPLFNAGRFLDIARYNVGDLYATSELYKRWKDYLQF